MDPCALCVIVPELWHNKQPKYCQAPKAKTTTPCQLLVRIFGSLQSAFPLSQSRRLIRINRRASCPRRSDPQVRLSARGSTGAARIPIWKLGDLDQRVPCDFTARCFPVHRNFDVDGRATSCGPTRESPETLISHYARSYVTDRGGATLRRRLCRGEASLVSLSSKRKSPF